VDVFLQHDVVCVWSWMGRRNHVLDGDPKKASSENISQPFVKYREYFFFPMWQQLPVLLLLYYYYTIIHNIIASIFYLLQVKPREKVVTIEHLVNQSVYSLFNCRLFAFNLVFFIIFSCVQMWR